VEIPDGMRLSQSSQTAYMIDENDFHDENITNQEF
jgi:hypothetical protein